MGIHLEEKKKNNFKVEMMYSNIGEYVGSGGDGDVGVVYERDFESEYFTEKVLPYIEVMINYIGGMPEEGKADDKKAVALMNVEEGIYREVWDKLVDEGLIEYGVEYFEGINMEYVDGNGMAYNVYINQRPQVKEGE